MDSRVSDLATYVFWPLGFILVVLRHQSFYKSEDNFIWYENLGVSLNLIAISLVLPLLFKDNLYSIRYFRLSKANKSVGKIDSDSNREYCFEAPYDNHRELRRLDWQLLIIIVYSFISLNLAVLYEVKSNWIYTSFSIGFLNCVFVWIVIFSKVIIHDEPRIKKNIF